VVVVSDTSPVSGLYRINHLFVLQRLFGKVILPESVFQELLELRSFGYDLQEVLTAEWIEIKSAADISAVAHLQNHLDLGEAEAIVIAKELHADLLILDETKGRAIAKQEGIAIIGLAGVLIEAKLKGHIALVKPLLDRLIHEANFRISRKLYELVLIQIGEIA
jgi:predicted nucleic acid-binding protein